MPSDLDVDAWKAMIANVRAQIERAKVLMDVDVNSLFDQGGLLPGAEPFGRLSSRLRFQRIRSRLLTEKQNIKYAIATLEDELARLESLIAHEETP